MSPEQRAWAAWVLTRRATVSAREALERAEIREQAALARYVEAARTVA